MARLIKPCSMKDSHQKSPRFVPPPIGVVGRNGKAAFPTKTQNGNRWDKTGKQKSGFWKPFTGAHPGRRWRGIRSAVLCRDILRELACQAANLFAPIKLSDICEDNMAARKWTDEQKARQAVLIRTWAPWKQSTGPTTPAGKKVSSKNAVNYSCRELLREMARSNRELVNYINGYSPAPKPRNRATTDSLIDDIEKALGAADAERHHKATKTATAVSKSIAEVASGKVSA